MPTGRIVQIDVNSKVKSSYVDYMKKRLNFLLKRQNKLQNTLQIVCAWTVMLGFNSTPQFQTEPLSSTHRFHTMSTPFQHPKSLSSTPKTAQFHIKNPSVQHRNPLCSTPKPPKFRLPQFHTKHSLVCWTEGFLVWNWGFLGAGKEWLFCVELMCWTERDPALMIVNITELCNKTGF